MRIGLDIDGVIRPWYISIYRHFCSLKGFEGDEYEFWDYFRTLSPSTQEYYVSIPVFYLDTMPSKDVLTYLPKIAELGEIYYITACPESAIWSTEKFFKMYDLPFRENLIFSKDKATNVRRLKLDVFLDDMIHNIKAIEGLTDAYLFKASHNVKDRDGQKVINSMKEFYELLAGK